MKANAVLMLSLLLLVAAAQAQQIYRWVDADGKVRYTTEKPPARAGASVVQQRVSSVGGNTAQPAKPAAEKPVVKMYATDWCPICKRARHYFAKNGVAYTELDIEKSAAAKEDFLRLGGKGVPVILVGERRMNGFSEQGMAAMLKAAGY